MASLDAVTGNCDEVKEITIFFKLFVDNENSNIDLIWLEFWKAIFLLSLVSLCKLAPHFTIISPLLETWVDKHRYLVYSFSSLAVATLPKNENSLQ